MTQGWVFDCESDNLYLMAKTIWYIRLKSLDGTKQERIYPFRETAQESKGKFMAFAESFPDGALVVGHNILGFDTWLVWKLLGIKPRVGKGGKDWIEGKHVQFVDTFVLSQYLNPNQPLHSLAYLSGEDEESKIDYRKSLVDSGAMTGSEPKGHEFTFWNDLMIAYCDRDVDANINVFNRLWNQAKEMYGESKWIHPSFRQNQKDFFLYQAQAYTGVRFNQEKAQTLVTLIQAEMDKIKKEVEPELPPRPLKTAEEAHYRIPAKPFNKDGSQSATMKKWLEKHDAVALGTTLMAYGQEYEIVPGFVLPIKPPMEIDDNTELKDWFLAQGWEPHEDFWNVQKKDGKPVRDEKNKFIRTTPKINHAGKICPNLSKLQGDIPKKVVKFLSYRNRLGVVNGWLSNPRLTFDGRLSAEISGYAPTSRVKHRTVVNVPKAADDVLLGAEMRDLFYVDDGFWYVGTDAAALENRTLASWTYKYDGGKFAKMQIEGDPHSFNAFAFFPQLHKEFSIEDQSNKDNPRFKPWRNKAKTGAYLLAFGGGAPKLASSLGLSSKDGKKAFDNYWQMNEGLGKLKEAVELYYSTTGSGSHIPGIDGRLISVRGKNVLLSCIGQGTGAVVMSYAACMMDNWLGELELDSLGRPYYLLDGHVVKRISMVHDEYSWEVEDGAEDWVMTKTVQAMTKSGEFLKLSLPIAGEAKKSFEGSWRDVH